MKHKADKYNIEITWHHCDIRGCDYKCKHGNTLEQHKAYKHGFRPRANRHDIEVTLQHCHLCNKEHR